MMNETHKWFWYGNSLFMLCEDGIIALDLKQIEHPK